MTYKSVLRLLHTRPILSQRQPRTSKLNRRLSNPRLIWKQGVVSIKYCLVLLNPRLPLWSRLRFWCTMSLRRVSKPSLVLTRHGLGYTVTLAIVTGICFTNKTHKLVSLLFLQGLLLLQATERQPSNFCLQNFHQFITYKPRFELLIIKLSPELLHISYRRWYIQMEYTGQWYIGPLSMRQEWIYKHWRVRGVPVKWNRDMQGYFGVTHARVGQNHVVVYKVR